MPARANNNRLEALKCSIACLNGNEKLESILNRAEAFYEFLENAPDSKSSSSRVARTHGSDDSMEAVTGGRKRQAGSG